MNPVRWVRVATAGRRFRTYVGRFSGGRRIPGGARPIEQVIGFVGTLALSWLACWVLPYNTLIVFSAGTVLAFIVVIALSQIKYDGVPVMGKTARILGLVFDRKPTVLAREELDRQAAANPHAFVVDDAPALDVA